MNTNENMIAEYRPRFVLWTSFLAQLPLQVVFSLWAAIFLGGLYRFFISTYANGSLAGASGIIGLAVMAVFPLISLSIKRVNYANTVYRVYPDGLYIEEGFLTRHKKQISLASMQEINLRCGILQRMVNLGSIYIATTATGQGPWWQVSAVWGGTSTFGSGAMMMDLADADDAYNRIRDLLEVFDSRDNTSAR